MTLNQKASQKNFKIIQISDTHLMDRDDINFLYMNPEQSFHAVIRQIQQEYPDMNAIIHTGDLAQISVEATYQRYLQFMQTLNVPHYQIPGNHDNIDIFPFLNHENKVHVVHFGQWSIVLLNSAVKNKVSGDISAEHLQQLDQILSEIPTQFVIVTCHHHPLEMSSHWIDQHKLNNAQDLKEILAKHQNIKAVLFGHVHQDSVNQWNNIQFFSTPATSIQFKPLSHDFALDGAAPGYRVLELKENGEFETKVHRLSLWKEEINLNVSGY